MLSVSLPRKARQNKARIKEVNVRHKVTILSVALASMFVLGCSGKKKQEATKSDPIATEPAVPAPQSAPDKAPDKTSKSLIVATSEFKADDQGKYTVPDAAVLIILKNQGSRWTTERIEDKESNVFHKALPLKQEGILTLGGNEAKLKLWKKTGGTWQAKTLWHKQFGGKHNRLRDFEMADFNKDGKDDLAIATHDQGVVAVVWQKESLWEPEEIDQKPNTFVHEIEIGDLDGNGNLEIYATPSQPNTVSGKDQGGKVVQYTWNGKGFDRKEVISLETRHIKEILVADVDGDNTQELYAVIEAEVDGMTLKKPVEIRRFDLVEGKFVEKSVTSINDRFCRFLTVGDIDHDGKNELVAAAFSSGVWVIEQEGDAYSKKCIDSKSGGFEHAAYISDLDGDNKQELYVADDRSGTIQKYTFKNGAYSAEIISRRLVPSQAMVWNLTETKH